MPSRAQVGPNVAMDTAESRAFLQDRVAFFAAVMLGIAVGFGAFTIGLLQIYPEVKSEHQEVFYAVVAGAMGAMAVVALLARGPKRYSAGALLAMDLVNMMPWALAWGASVYVLSDRPHNPYVILMLTTFGIIGRALLVPSTAWRTLWISVLSGLPVMLATLGIALRFPERMGLPAMMVAVAPVGMLALAIVLATIGSSIIYGLREQVEEAKQLGQYTLEQRIGKGGMGSVYRASHAMLRRPTAIKLLPIELAGTDSLDQFEREVQATSELTHPNTVAIYDYGRSPNGQFYYAMEYLDGADLESLVRDRGPQPAARVVHILAQVCGALEEAHGRGLIHRDIKPANIILCQRGSLPDVAKVVDFGLVKELESESHGDDDHLLAGTPAYVSPEAVSEPSLIGPRSDLYGLGAVGYYLLTGTTVFDADDPIEMCQRHVDTPPVPVSARTNAAIPDGLEALIMQCLAKERDGRPKSARAMRDTLTELGEATPWDEAEARRWWRDYHAQRESKKTLSSAPTIAMTVDLTAR
jgi:serine/threonine-protein kinase